MAKYANQKSFTIERNPVSKNTKEVYLCIYGKSLEEAMIDLNGVAFKVYIYLMMNADGYKFDFSPQYLQDKYKFNRSSIYAALKELEEKSYIKKTGDNKYIAYETAQAAEAKEEPEVEVNWWGNTQKPVEGAVIVPMRKKPKKEPVNYLDCANWDDEW